MKLGNPINHHIVMQIQILNEEEVEILKANINTRRYFYKFTKGQGFATQKIPDSFIDDMRTKCVQRGAISKPFYQWFSQKHNMHKWA